MPTCEGTVFRAIALEGRDDADALQVVKAEILSIDRTARTAELLYLTVCAGFTRTEDVEFFYYCEYSRGLEDELEQGHWAFKVGDIVYVSRFPAYGSTAERLYIIGHVDIRDTKPCKSEWFVLRFCGKLRGTEPFYIIDIVTGKLYDGWPEVTWPIFPSRLWDDPRSDGFYKIDEYRAWRIARRNSVSMVHPAAWDYLRWSTYNQAWELLTSLNEWDEYAHNPFRTGCYWDPGHLYVQGSATTYYGPATTTTDYTDYPTIDLCAPDGRCWFYRSSWNSITLQGSQSGEYSFASSVDTYNFDLDGIPPYNENHIEVAIDNSTIGNLVRRYVADGEDIYDDYHYRSILWPPLQGADTYDRTRREVFSGEHFKEMQMIFDPLLAFDTVPAGYYKYYNACFLVEGTTEVWSGLCPITYTVEHVGHVSRGNPHYGCCYASSEIVSADYLIEVTASFSFKSPWSGTFHSATVTNSLSVTNVFPWSSYSADYSFDGHGHWAFWEQAGAVYYDAVINPVSHYTDIATHADIRSLCISHGSTGVWAIAVGAYWGDGAITVSGTGLSTGAKTSHWTIDVEKLVVAITMGHYSKANYDDIADVRISNISEISAPELIKDYVRSLILWKYYHDPATLALLPAPYGTLPDTDVNPNVLTTYDMYIEIFPVLISPPPPP